MSVATATQHHGSANYAPVCVRHQVMRALARSRLAPAVRMQMTLWISRGTRNQDDPALFCAVKSGGFHDGWRQHVFPFVPRR
jgi:hypothetical protein